MKSSYLKTHFQIPIRRLWWMESLFCLEIHTKSQWEWNEMTKDSQKSNGDDHTYVIIILNHNHPQLREILKVILWSNGVSLFWMTASWYVWVNQLKRIDYPRSTITGNLNQLILIQFQFANWRAIVLKSSVPCASQRCNGI